MKKIRLFFILLVLCTNPKFQFSMAEAQEESYPQLLYSSGSASRFSFNLHGSGFIKLLDLADGEISFEASYSHDNESTPIVCPSFSADGHYLVYSLIDPVFIEETDDPMGNIGQSVYVDLETGADGALHEWTFGYADVFCPQWSREGNRLLFTGTDLVESNDGNEAGIFDFDLGQPFGVVGTRLAETSTEMFSPDGRQLVVIELQADGRTAHVIELERRGRIASIAKLSHFVGWTSDSGYMAFTGEEEGLSSLYIIPRVEDSNSNTPNIILPGNPVNTASVQDAIWSPQGHQIAFLELSNQANEYYSLSNLSIYDVSSQSSLLIAENVFTYAKPQWSYDGRYLLFLNSEQLFQVYNAETGSLISVPPMIAPSWSPVASQLLYLVPAESDFFSEVNLYEWNLYDIAGAQLLAEYQYQNYGEFGLGIGGQDVWHPSGRYVALASGFIILDVQENRLIRTGMAAQTLTWRPGY